MCTYNITINDTLVQNARRSFSSSMDINIWMQQQLERMLKQIAVPNEKSERSVRKLKVSDRIKALSAVPPCTTDADYKDEISVLLSDKY